MKKIWGAVALTTLMFAAAPAGAAVVFTSVGGSVVGGPDFLGGVAGSAYITFNDVTPVDPAPFSSGGYSFTGDGAVVVGSLGGAYGAPAGDATPYLSTGFDGVFGLRTTSVSFGTSYLNFGLYWGSIDEYNQLVFWRSGSIVATINGCDITPTACSGDQFGDNTNRYVNFVFSGGDAYDRVDFKTLTQPAFEVDSLAIANAVPELSTWIMMLLGFAGIGGLAYRRTKKGSAALAAA